MRKCCANLLKRQFSSGFNIKPKICVVGAGPAGFYAAQHLVKNIPDVKVDIFERLPVPFGLVRFGVAPDHPEVKNVINTFTKTAQHPNVRFIGNVNLGTDVQIKQLQESYHAVLLTYGADENRKLNIPGEDLDNVISARNFVGWYNGTPWDTNLKVDLSGKTVAIFGQGNVAVDVARILLSPIDELKKTDITQHALEQLAESKVKTVYLIGRRGPLQAAFTIKELREMLKLPNCRTSWRRENFTGVQEIVATLPRPKKRIAELMLKSLQETQSGFYDFQPVFFRSPLEILGEKKISGVKLGITKLEGDEILHQKAVLTPQTETLHCDLGITSIGYKSIPADDFPFDSIQGIAKNSNFKIQTGLYSSGWLATGPTGVILTTMGNAFATADVIATDLLLAKEDKPGFDGVREALKKKNLQLVEWEHWNKIDAFEQEEGKKLGKPREKVVDVKKMLEVAS